MLRGIHLRIPSLYDVWVDLANSPQVMFFAPIVRRLREEGVSALITVRDFSETVPLAERLGLNFKLVGSYGGKGKLGKVAALLRRALALYGTVRGKGIRLALSHNSYDAILAGRMAGLRVWTYMDYDGQPANHLAFRLAHRVHVQEWFPEEALRRFGAHPKRVVRYRGLKEEVYLRSFRPDPTFPDRVLAPLRRPLVVARPPSTTSLYSRGYGDFWGVLRILKGKGYDVRLLQRNPEDGEMASRYGIPLLPKPIDGPQLLYWSDAFVGGGGTMTREAVLLGARTFSVFPAVGFLDRRLMEMGLVERLNVEKAKEVSIEERRSRRVRHFNPHLLDEIVEEIVGYLRRFRPNAS